jgi:DNA-binding GntR family transcriptional regulator
MAVPQLQGVRPPTDLTAWNHERRADPFDVSDRLIRKTAGQEAADYIRRLVFDGTLRPGSRIPQGEVAEALGISRVPVREAIIYLEREGLVRVLPHRGAFVAAFDRNSVEDHYELCGLICGFAAQRAAERSTPEMIDRLTALCDALAVEEDPDKILQLARSFNNVMLEAGDSPRLRALVWTLTVIFPPGNFFAVVPGAIDVEKKHTAAVLRAIKRGEPERAFDACHRLMRNHGKCAIAFLEGRGLI